MSKSPDETPSSNPYRPLDFEERQGLRRLLQEKSPEIFYKIEAAESMIDNTIGLSKRGAWDEAAGYRKKPVKDYKGDKARRRKRKDPELEATDRSDEAL